LVKITGGRNEVGMSYGIIRAGTLEIRSGALTGQEDRIKRIDRHKRKGYISLRFYDKEIMAVIGLEITEKT